MKLYRGWWFEDEARSTSENNISIASDFVGRVVHASLFSYPQGTVVCLISIENNQLETNATLSVQRFLKNFFFNFVFYFRPQIGTFW